MGERFLSPAARPTLKNEGEEGKLQKSSLSRRTLSREERKESQMNSLRIHKNGAPRVQVGKKGESNGLIKRDSPLICFRTVCTEG